MIKNKLSELTTYELRYSKYKASVKHKAMKREVCLKQTILNKKKNAKTPSIIV